MKEKYDVIGTNYNATRKADRYLFDRLHELLLPTLEGRYLDIGCGTGNYTSAFAKKGYSFVGIDPSEEMLQKAADKNTSTTWRLGKAENIDLPSKSIDGVIASLTIHHWQDLAQGFTEISRVLKPNGKMVLFTATPAQMKGYWLCHYFPKMLLDSMIQMPTYDHIITSLQSSSLKILGTEKYFVKPDLQDLFLYAGKQNPKLYLDPVVRYGISSFSSLSTAKEVKKGLQVLEKDIHSGAINTIIKKYENTKGDYLFITLKKV